MTTTSHRLKEIMNARGLKQVDIIEACKPYWGDRPITKSNMSQWVSGHVNPDSTNTYILAKALNVSPGWLMGDEHSDKNKDRLISYIESASDEDVTMFINILKSIGKEI